MTDTMYDVLPNSIPYGYFTIVRSWPTGPSGDVDEAEDCDGLAETVDVIGVCGDAGTV